MPRGPSTKLKPFQKVLTVMISGKPVTIEEFETLLGQEIQMYRISTYMWHIKTIANGVIRPIKDGRQVTAYQLVNVNEMLKYMHRVGIKQVSKLQDLGAEQVQKESEQLSEA